MPIKPVQKIEAWSKSRYDVYEKCPLQAKLKFIDKIKEPSSPALEKGLRVHKEAEDYLNGKLFNLPESLQYFPEEFQMLLDKDARAEVSWAFTKDWETTDWFSKDAWCRLKLDACFIDGKTFHLIDFKTGKKRDGYEDQLELYAVGGMLMHNSVDAVSAELWFLDQGEIVDKTYTRDELPMLMEKWSKRVEPMLNDTLFAPNPGFHCRWCFFNSEKNGDCRFS